MNRDSRPITGRRDSPAKGEATNTAGSSGATRRPRTAIGVFLGSAAVTVFWLLDISWQATFAQPAFPSLPHLGLTLSAVFVGWTAVSLRLRYDGPVLYGLPHAGGGVARFRSGAWASLAGVGIILAALSIDVYWHAARPALSAVLSPPHAAVAAGVLIVQVGGLLVTLQLQDDPADPGARWQGLAYPVAAGLTLLLLTTVTQEYTARPHLWHGSEFYRVAAVVFPIAFVAVASSSSLSWPATVSAGAYMLATLILIWGFQAIPAAAANSQGHLLPPSFPLLLVIPAVAVDVILSRLGPADSLKRQIVVSGIIGFAFVMLLLLTHWHFAEFLLSSAARNPIFAADQWPHHAPAGDWRYRFWTLDYGARDMARGLLIAAFLAAASALVGLWLGRRLAAWRRTGPAPSR